MCFWSRLVNLTIQSAGIGWRYYRTDEDRILAEVMRTGIQATTFPALVDEDLSFAMGGLQAVCQEKTWQCDDLQMLTLSGAARTRISRRSSMGIS